MSEHEAGDHTLFVGAVESIELGEAGAGLVYRGGTLPQRVIDAVVFDLDGVILDTEELWNEVREGLARERGGRWSDSAQADMMGMSSTEWSRYMHDVVGLEESARGDQPRGRAPDARALRRAAAADRRRRRGRAAARGRWPLGLASSSNRELIDRVLEVSGVAPRFRATVSSEEVARGKPAPDVYLEAARRLGVPPEACAAVEDSASGIALRARSRHARRRDPERCLPAAGRRACAGRRRARIDLGARAATLSARAAADEIHPVTHGEQHVLDALVVEHVVVEARIALVLSS